MRHIYRKSQRGIIWFGELPVDFKDDAGFHRRHAATALELLSELDPDREPYLPHIAGRYDNEPNNLKQVILALVGSSCVKWRSIKWWQRIWTLQEALLPSVSIILWGSISLSLELLVRIAKRMPEKDEYFQTFSRLFGLQDLENEFYKPIMSLYTREVDPVLGPLYRWRARKASDGRDKVYALIGLLPISAFPNVPYCDYSLSCKELFIRVTFDLICSRGMLPLVGRRGEEHITPDLPSWAVDWASRSHAETNYVYFWLHRQKFIRFNANDGRFYAPSLLQNGGLVLSGIMVGSIAFISGDNLSQRYHGVSLGSNTRARTTVEEWTRLFRHWESTQPPDDLYVGGGSRQDAFWRTVLGDSIISDQEELSASENDYDDFVSYMKGSNYSAVAKSIRSMTHNQEFFITKDGYFGVGPRNLQRGDELWIPFCSKVPHVLHRQCGGELKYVGDAYVHGMMHGEAVREAKEAPRKITIY
ncbi:MAG: hypothetical protein Q9227_001733 [Pyrenula ochraceoflavens]